MAEAKLRVLITGAAGNVGATLWQAWEEEDKYELTLVDLRPIEQAWSRTEIGDVCDLGFMRRICQHQDVLVHLAFLRDENVGPDSDTMSDIGLALALFETARKSGIGRIVFASTNKVNSGSKSGNITI